MKHASIAFLGMLLFLLAHHIGRGQNTISLVDSFSQGNANGWMWKTGSWTFVDSMILTGPQVGHHFLIQPHYMFSDFIFQADVMKLDDVEAEHPALVFRWMNDTMNYVFRINGVGSQSWIQLLRDMDNRDQNAQVITTSPWFTDENNHRMYKGVWYTMKVQADSSHIKCKVWRTSDPEPTTWNLDVIDYQYTQGNIGLEYYSGTHKFDNVTVTGQGAFVNGISEDNQLDPATYFMSHNYPNPFNPSTSIDYQLPLASRVILRVYNVLGQVIATITNKIQSAGFRSATWNATDVASGIYFYRMDAVSVIDPSKSFTQVKKMILLK